jgi:hypothetical protein
VDFESVCSVHQWNVCFAAFKSLTPEAANAPNNIFVLLPEACVAVEAFKYRLA